MILQILSTGCVSLLSIPFVTYNSYISNIRTYLCLLYLTCDLYIPKKTSEICAQFVVHHLITIYLIFIQGEYPTYLIQSTFFLESSALVGYLSKYFHTGKQISKLYWLYDRMFRMPLCIFKYRMFLTNDAKLCFSVLQYLNIIWTFEVFKFRHKYVHGIWILLSIYTLTYPPHVLTENYLN
jgi:hypothetical protein